MKRAKKARNLRERMEDSKRLTGTVFRNTAGGEVPYKRGAGFLSKELPAWLYTAEGSAAGALGMLEEGLWSPREAPGVRARAIGLQHQARCLAKAVKRREWDHAVFHALLLGNNLGALGRSSVVDFKNRQLQEAQPYIERGHQFTGQGGRRSQVADVEIERRFKRAQQSPSPLKGPELYRWIGGHLHDKDDGSVVSLGERTVQRRLQDMGHLPKGRSRRA
jgi:hypothetical protein